jgi:threonine dehydrogenase-like Zn-dependent dehydrogenase
MGATHRKVVVMNGLVYHGPGNKEWEEVPKPTLLDDGDAIVRVDAVTICGTDLHILKGDVPAVTDGAFSVTKRWGPSKKSVPA